ncbi:rho GTPase-activating protein 12-like isoform X4 [Haliotis rufescens]|uniref:rho GTPase-activating protein 12-like isoform X4 n=1 Tax=Haliotis rufescens TaxID=6454 RepID=UPI00201ED298|nr:rho GTPase-activating protein 12-like isoform X4 [Haliotis rufescens]
MSVDEEKGLVEVLYDYSYEDDNGTVTIVTGELYTLLEQTNTEWWQVKRSDREETTFYVPAQYVRIISQDDAGIYCNQDTFAVEDVNDNDGRTTPLDDFHRESPRIDVSNGERPGVLPLNTYDGGNSVEVQYANLDDYRMEAGLPKPVGETKQHEPIEYANLPLPGEGENFVPPLPGEGDPGRRLVEYLPWYIYNEHGPGRPYYINEDTGERAFKPPRHKNQKIAEKLSPTLPKVNFDLTGSLTSRESEYDEVKDDGKVFHVHKKTKDKKYHRASSLYERIRNESGDEFFCHVKTGETFWQLPSDHSIRVHNGETVDENRNRQMSQSMRISKAKSLCEGIDFMKGANMAAKSSTLPPSFSYTNSLSAGDTPPSSKPRPSSPTIRFDDQLTGILNKAKIAEVGKRVKKNWSQSYVVLHGSNIIFYKDQKAAVHRPGSPHGKPEFIVSLLGAKVNFSQNTEVTSKKNVITLTANSNTQFLLQCDEEATARNWFFRLKIAADDLHDKNERKPEQKPEQKPERKPEPSPMEKNIMRSQSVEETPGGASERHPSLNATYFRIRDKLRSLITRRPLQEDLVKRGIIKDRVFGSDLRELCEREHNTVPAFVTKCIAAVEQKGLDHDGLYRVSGNLAEIQKLRFIVDKEETYSLDDESCDINVLTGALKLFFRELKEPLFPFSMFDRFTTAIRKEKNSQKLQAFKELVLELPKCHYHTMRALFKHLTNVIAHSKENRMQTQNVAIVFGPTLMWSDGEAGGMAVMTIIQSKVVEYVLLEYDRLFP